MKNFTILLIFLLASVSVLQAQEVPADGLLAPRKTTDQRIAMVTSLDVGETLPDGLMVYDITTRSFWYWNAASGVAAWVESEALTVLGIATNDNGTPSDSTDDFQALEYLDEDGDTTILNLSAAVASEEALTVLGQSTNDGVDGIAGNADDFQQLTYLDEDGDTTTINLTAAVASEETLTTIAQAAGNADAEVALATPTANTIASYADEDGATTTINETVTVLSSEVKDNGTTGDASDDFVVITYVSENGTTATINLPALNMYNTDGTLATDRVVTQADKKIIFKGDATGSIDAFSIANENDTALTVDTKNIRIGVGTTAPTSKLDVVGLPLLVDNAAAKKGVDGNAGTADDLSVGAFYHAGDGIVRVVF